tara:strand:- start:316 stop:1329 length:1014 start_codon:yes stop_codon:yes gene_type:complete
MAKDYLNLNKVDNAGDSTVSSLIKDNTIEFFDWAIINGGGFFNVNIPTSGHYGGDKHKLRLVDDPRYSSGQVWEGFRSNWVWQSGLECETQPLVTNKWHNPGISGVFVNGSFYASGDSTYGHHIDYPRGRVVFDSAISTTSSVTAEFSYKWVNVVPADKEFFREVQYRSQRADGDFTYTGSGDYSQLADNRLQLPAIAVDVTKRRNLEPYALGALTHYINTDVVFHVLAEDSYTRDKLVDMVSLQEEKVVYMFDSDRIGRNDAFPLDYRGQVRPSGLSYPDLIKPSGHSGESLEKKGYRWEYSDGKMTFRDARIQEGSEINPNLYHGVVRLNAEVIK